jgi:hypothetical protein
VTGPSELHDQDNGCKWHLHGGCQESGTSNDRERCQRHTRRCIIPQSAENNPQQAPIDNPGVSRPPSAPARRAPSVTSTLSSSSTTASVRPMLLPKTSCATLFPLPNSCGNGVASRPMSGNTTAHHNGSRQSRGACARAAPAPRANQYAANPNTGPITTDQTHRPRKFDRSALRIVLHRSSYLWQCESRMSAVTFAVVLQSIL